MFEAAFAFFLKSLLFAVGNGPTIYVVAKEIRGPRDGRIDLRIFHASPLAQHNRELGG